MNPVEELTQQAGLTATDDAHPHGPDQSPTPLQKKVPPHRLRADGGETAGQRAGGAAPPSAPGPFRAPPAVPRLLLPSASHGREAPLLRQGRAGRGALGTPAQGLHGSTRAGINRPPLIENRLSEQHPAGKPPSSPPALQVLELTESHTSARPQNTHTVFRPKHLLEASAPPLVIADGHMSVAEQKQQ